MAQTAAEKKAAQAALKQAQAFLAKQKKQLAGLEAQMPSPARVNTTTIQGINAASGPAKPTLSTDDIYYGTKVGTTGLTQAQIDTRASAAGVSSSINENYGNLGIKSTIDPKTGMITTTQDGKKITNNPVFVPGVGGGGGYGGGVSSFFDPRRSDAPKAGAPTRSVKPGIDKEAAAAERERLAALEKARLIEERAEAKRIALIAKGALVDAERREEIAKFLTEQETM